MKTLFLGGAVVFMGSLVFAADDISKPTQGTSSVAFTQDKAGNKKVEIHNLTYLYTDALYLTPGKDAKAMTCLVEQEQSSSVSVLSDTPPASTLKAKAWISPQDSPRKLLWNLETSGDSAKIEDPFYAVTRDGFEDDFVTYIYFRMADGKQAYLTNTPLLTIYSSVDGSTPRYVGFRSQFAENEMPKELTAKKIFGIVYYGDDKGVTKKIGIFGKPDEDEPTEPSAYLMYEKARVEANIVYLRDNKETGAQAFGLFSVVILLSEGLPAEIPFEKDAPQLDKAKLPKGYTAELIP